MFSNPDFSHGPYRCKRASDLHGEVILHQFRVIDYGLRAMAYIYPKHHQDLITLATGMVRNHMALDVLLCGRQMDLELMFPHTNVLLLLLSSRVEQLDTWPMLSVDGQSGIARVINITNGVQKAR